MTCPAELELARAITDGADPPLAAHLADCAACRQTFDGTQRAIELARTTAPRMPPPEHREELRTSILSARPRSAPAARGHLLGLGGALAAAAAIAAFVGTRPDPAPAPRTHAHGTIVPHAGARFTATSARPDEIVYLEDGVIDVAVTPLDPGERFRVVTSDAEVEVHGTAFQVTAHDRRIVDVHVLHGIVEVRPLGGTPAFLHAGDAWAPPPPPLVKTAEVTPPPSDPVVIPAPPKPRVIQRTAAPIVPSPAPARSPQAIAYDDAWTALRANDFAKASAVFARAAILDPDGPLAEDASYWYPVSLARAKRPEAAGAFRDFLERYPKSTHAGEANAMLGWLLVDAADRTEAERRFRAAIDDPSAAVRKSARSGLEALGVP